MHELKSLTAALSLAAFVSAAPAFAESPAGVHGDEARAPSNEMLRDSEMLDPEREAPIGSGAESHTRMAHTGRPDVRSGESIEDAKEEAEGEDEDEE